MPRRREGARTIAVLNGKGGSSKTPTTAMLAAVFARSGRSVLAWDNNETSGTLGWRTEHAAHEAHVRDLLPQVDRLRRSGRAATGLARYVHHQPVDGYDVLQSNPAVLAAAPPLTGEDFDAVFGLVTDCYDVVVIDSGNAEDAPNWLRMLERVDQIVVSTTTSSEHVAAARLLLSALHSRDARAAALASEAVVVVSRVDREAAPAEDVAGQFEWLARSAVTIAYDPGMRAERLRHDGLAPATQKAWREAADAVEAAQPVAPREESLAATLRRDATPAPPASEPAAPVPPPSPQPEDEPSEDHALSTPWLARHRWTVVAAAVAVILLVAAFFAGGALLGPGPQGPFTAPSGKAPVEPVAGWTKQADWISPSLAPVSRDAPVLEADGTIITTVKTTSGTELVGLRAKDGMRLWHSPIEGELTGPPQLITRGDDPAIVAATDNSLIRWSGLGGPGEPPATQTWDFTEAGLELVPGSPVPLLVNEDTLTARVLVDDQLQLVSLPSGGRPIAADASGTVTTVTPDGHWSTSAPDQQRSDTSLLKPPAFGSLVEEVLGTEGGTLVVSWTGGEDRSYVAGYDTADDMRPLWTTSVLGHPTPETFRASPDGGWAIAGRAAIDLQSGQATRLPRDWVTLSVTDDRAWSTHDVVTRSGRVIALEERVADSRGVPGGVTAGGLALVVAAADEGAPRIYALRPDADTTDA